MHLKYVALNEDSLGLKKNRLHLISEGHSSNLGGEMFVNIFT